MQVRVGLVGAGIRKSLSPRLHEAEGRALGLDYRYTLFDLNDEPAGDGALPRLLERLREDGYAGFNVTFPVKQTIMPLLDGLSPEAEAMGAVNTVRLAPDGTAEGHNTDWWGFGEGLRRGLGTQVPGEVVLLGAGGAGAAAGYALGRQGVRRLRIADRDGERAEALAVRLRERGFAAEALAYAELGQALVTADGLVHATPTGMTGHPGLPIDLAWLRPALWVAEIVYVPLETELLRAARAAGCPTVNGGSMVVLQAARAIEIFTGRQPDTDRMLANFAELAAA